MIVRGVDIAAVRRKMEIDREAKAARHLIIDGDGPAYRVAATVKRLPTAIANFQAAILTELHMTGCGSATVHLTHRTCLKNNRPFVNARKTYQGQRKNKPKPPLLEPLREAMMQKENWLPEFQVRMHYDIEADDAMTIQAHHLGMDGVIWSDDKDLRCTPYLYYNQSTGTVEGPEPHGWVGAKLTDSGNLKVIGRGPIFFWAQMLMGDSADNVAGLAKYNGALCGPAATLKILGEVRDRDEAANLVIDGYRQIEQNVIAEGYLLHLLQHPRDHVFDYIMSHDLTPENREFVQWCMQQPWMRQSEHEEVDLPWD